MYKIFVGAHPGVRPLFGPTHGSAPTETTLPASKQPLASSLLPGILKQVLSLNRKNWQEYIPLDKKVGKKLKKIAGAFDNY